MDPVLYKAATSSSIDLFTEKKDDPSFFLQETLEKNSALHLAAKFKQKLFAEKIIDLHPHLLYRVNSKGDTPLHIAASVGCLEIAKLIIAIHLNIESRDVETIKELLRIVNLENDTALHNAVRNDHLEIVKLMIEKDPELAGFINANEDSPLFLAVDRSHFKIARYILDKVPDCSYQGRNQMNALHAAILRDCRLKPFWWWKRVYLSREGFMEAFIQKFPSAIKESDAVGWTPLHYAAFLGNTIAVELLLKNNDKQMPAAHTYVYHKDKEGLSALHIAAKDGRVQVMKRLTETFPDICELVDKRGRTALHVAVENGRVDTVQYVLKTPSLEGLINVQDTEGNTSLHLAAIHGCYKIVNNLADDTRVDRKAMNKEGFTAIGIIESKMELVVDFRTYMPIERKLKRADSLSLEGILRRENREKENVEMKEQGHIESMKDRADEKKREGMVVKKLSLDTKRKRAKDKELIIFKNLKEAASTFILVSTIIATVTFAAGFTMPGGYKSDGMAVLSRKTAFQSFLISNTIALYFSASSMVFHFIAASESNPPTFINLINWAAGFTGVSIIAMVIAFISGTNVVLAGSSGLAIVNIAIGCCFFLFFSVMMYIR